MARAPATRVRAVVRAKAKADVAKAAAAKAAAAARARAEARQGLLMRKSRVAVHSEVLCPVHSEVSLWVGLVLRLVCGFLCLSRVCPGSPGVFLQVLSGLRHRGRGGFSKFPSWPRMPPKRVKIELFLTGEILQTPPPIHAVRDGQVGARRICELRRPAACCAIATILCKEGCTASSQDSYAAASTAPACSTSCSTREDGDALDRRD